ncbi:MAG: hypothetical protein U1E31_01825 [Rickettsiales bacterium]
MNIKNIADIAKIIIYKYIFNKNKNIEVTINLIAILYCMDTYKEKINFNIILPITGFDIMSIVNNHNKIKDIMTFAQEIYIASDFKLTKDEILEKAKAYAKAYIASK